MEFGLVALTKTNLYLLPMNYGIRFFRLHFGRQDRCITFFGFEDVHNLVKIDVHGIIDAPPIIFITFTFMNIRD